VVTAKTQYNLKNAREYFEEHLCVDDYYREGQLVSGEWLGVGAERLGLSGQIRADGFLRLCENEHPSTGETLTQRLNGMRTEQNSTVANRRIFYDFTFSPPKSVSIAGFLGNDGRILEAHGRAVRSALREFEAFAATRIRGGGATNDRLTGNFIAALFAHDTSRALDPHLHTHCIVFNATFDAVENRWKALQNHELLRARKYAENIYYHELARELRSFGYRLQNQARGDFRIEGISEELCERFSKRHTQIDKEFAQLLKDHPELPVEKFQTARAMLAETNRARKQKGLDREDLSRLWDAQLSDAERDYLRQITARGAAEMVAQRHVTAFEAIQWAEEHLFDRNSVVLECQLWQHALERGRGQNFSISELKEIARQRDYIRKPENPAEVTRRDVLLREWEIIQTVKEGIGGCYPLVWSPGPANPELDHEQRRVLGALLSSINRVSLFRGGAGTGKSFVLREVIREASAAGRQVVVLAPQRQQVVDMEEAGFPSPATVTSFLLKNELAQGALVVVDEAGQIGGRQMLELMRLVRQSNARLILSGDTRQHGAVEASDALLAIERYSEIRPVELHKIRRQDPALGRDKRERKQIRQYRKVVELAAEKKFDASFDGLDKMGAVVACGLGEQVEKLADEYVRLLEQNASAVAVSQTWNEVHRINLRIREALKAKGLLGGNDMTVEVLDRLDLTNAQKRDERFYSPNAVIVFNQKIHGAEPGTKGKLAGILKSSVLIEVGGKYVTISNRLLDRITVCVPRAIALASGDRLHLKANRKLASGARVTNGELVTVKSVDASGWIELNDGRILDEHFREFLPGYALTSYGSQGKTVDYVLFSDSTVKAATNAQQWYVTISRGRRGIRIFTPDKEQLRENVARSGHRPLAMELQEGFQHAVGYMLWDRLHACLLRFGQHAASAFCRLKKSRLKNRTQRYEHQITRIVGQ
jgi:conjugative relaxase-like TrwC/TraI family protein